MSDAPAAKQNMLPPPTELKGRVEQPERGTDEVLHALDNDKAKVTPAEAASALEWFLSEDPEELPGLTHEIELNVGVGDREQWIKWTIRPIDADELRRINRTMTAQRKRSKGDDVGTDVVANLRVIVAGSVDPNIEQECQRKGVDPVGWTHKRFQHKPGLITQIANQIMNLSGFDDEDVRDAIRARN